VSPRVSDSPGPIETNFRSSTMLKKIVLLCLLIPVPALAVFLAVGKKVNYLQTDAKLAYAGHGSVVVLTRDERPYVLDGHKTRDFVGLLRGGYGNPFDVLNETGHPLADDVSASIASSLKTAGFTASVDVPAAAETAEQAVARVAAQSPDHVVVVRLLNLKTDGYAHINWFVEANVSVYDRSGALVGTIDSKLEKPIGKVSGKYVDFAAKITGAYREALEGWLNDAKLQAALAPAGQDAPAATTAATATAAPAAAETAAPEAAPAGAAPEASAPEASAPEAPAN
jgi:hypothetical protein